MIDIQAAEPASQIERELNNFIIIVQLMIIACRFAVYH